MAPSVNPLADIVDCDDRRGLHLAQRSRRGRARGRSGLAGMLRRRCAHPRIAVMLVRWTGKPAWDDIAAWLDNLAGLLGERLLRVKGVVAVADSEHALLVQSVGTMFSAPRPFAGPVARPFSW